MNILNIIETEGLKLKKVGTEYQGPCPFCQAGTDRFHVHPDKGEHGTYWCRVCGQKGDVIQFLRDYKGMGYKEACGFLGKKLKEIQRKAKGPKTPVAAPSTGSGRTEGYEPRECKGPEEMWRERAEALVEWGQQNLINSPQPSLNLRGGAEGGGVIDWLAARGISMESIERFRLGWNPGENEKDIYRSRSSWGLPEEKNSQGKFKKVWIPRGLIIPCLTPPSPLFNKEGEPQGVGVCRIRIRRPDVKEGEDRFILIPGGYTGPMVISTPPNPLFSKEGEPKAGAFEDKRPKAWVIVESELDAILIAQEIGDVVGVMAMGNNIARPDGPAFKQLKESLCILNAMDYDEGGAVALGWWQKHFTQCERWPVPKAKDPGDYYKEGGNIREWVMAGLPPVFKVQLPPTPSLIKEGVPKAGALYHVIEAADGRRVYITDDISEYKRLQRERKIVFNSKELALVRPESAGQIMNAKEIWKQAEVVEPMELNSPQPPLKLRGGAEGGGVIPDRVTSVSKPIIPEPQQGGLF